MSEGFFGRWSRRKQEALAQQPEPATGPECGDQQALASALIPERAAPAQAEPDQNVASAPVPTLEDVRMLTPESDFQPFMRSGVGAEVRNAAMKKLFTDPHFNVMDGLDIYIDDYSQPDPMPAGMLRKMASATEAEIHEFISEKYGIDTRSLEIRTVTDQKDALAMDVTRVRAYPYLPPHVTVAGAIFDVRTGQRSVLDFLLKPVTKTLDDAFGER